MLKHRNYWTYSIACFVVWGILLVLTAAKSRSGRFHDLHPRFLLAGPSAGSRPTIARSVYPPPRRWLQQGENRAE